MLVLLKLLLTFNQTSKSPNHKRILALETAQATIEELADDHAHQNTAVEVISHREESIDTHQAHKTPHENETIVVDLGMITAAQSRLAMVDETMSTDTMVEGEADHALHRTAATTDQEAQCETVEWKMICRYQNALLEMFQMCKSSSLMTLIVSSSSGPKSRFKHVVCVSMSCTWHHTCQKMLSLSDRSWKAFKRWCVYQG